MSFVELNHQFSIFNEVNDGLYAANVFLPI